MGRSGSKITERVLHRMARRHWARVADQADNINISNLRTYRKDARELRKHINALIAVADGRLALPRLGSNLTQSPAHSDWVWRPEIWAVPLEIPGVVDTQNNAKIGTQAQLFHDGTHGDLMLRQMRNNSRSDLAPFSLKMDVFDTGGSYVSVVVDLPESALDGLTKNHIIRADIWAQIERPIGTSFRLNIQHGPNSEQILNYAQFDQDHAVVEFDLAYAKIHEKRVEKIWIDLIFEKPWMTQIVLRDVTFSRQIRAEL
ncbi:DUF6478 family protein [Parasulfitobacter algicola]|uniref:Uncharacterized protein n=1 Tax=Parasulfitobacter algicola TaxID=2614809 RepID=A0ABX2INW0_9RHOB|nr:DUF6478 family protein [Sulfitobacter algicola]NSX54586.1 hypothetical protein [Sulfitobacter algicola]